MGYIRTEVEAEMMIEEMKRKSKSKYITQGVAFNKESERQMELLKYALMYSNSFSGMVKELLADNFESNIENKTISNGTPDIDKRNELKYSKIETAEKKDVGNFLL